MLYVLNLFSHPMFKAYRYSDVFEMPMVLHDFSTFVHFSDVYVIVSKGWFCHVEIQNEKVFAHFNYILIGTAINCPEVYLS